MATTRKHLLLKDNNDTGFGGNPDNYGGRFVNRDGSFNVRKEGHFDFFSGSVSIIRC